MNSSKEDLIEMAELTSPDKKLPRPKLKKRNQVHSPPFLSPARSSDRDVTSLFSVKNISRKSSPDEDDTETISELSDNLLSESSSRYLSKTESGWSSARSAHIRSNEKISKLKKSMNQIRRESSQVDANIKSIRSKFQLDEKRTDQPELSFFNFGNEILENGEEEVFGANEKLSLYVLPENLEFNMSLAERDSLSTSNRRRSIHLDNSVPLRDPVVLESVKPDVRVQNGDCTEYCPPNLFADMDEVVVIKNHVLELSLLHLQFVHHPLFSLEHVLQGKLKEVFEIRSRTAANDTLEKLKGELKALRDARTSRRDEGVHGADFNPKDMRKLRESLFREGKVERERLKCILHIWKAIKKLRSTQKYSNTNVRLIIKKEKSDLSEDKEKYEHFFREILEDILEEHKAAYKRKLKEYNKKLKAKEETISKEISDSEDGGQEKSDLEKPVYEVNASKVEHELRTRFEESFRPPGEPQLVLYLKEDHVVTDSVENDEECARRKVTSSTKFTVKILCDDIPVCKSKPVSLNDDFALDVNEMFSIQLTNIPRFLRLEIYEHPKGLLKKKLTELRVDIPNATVCYDRAKHTETHFERREIVHYKHAGVGSGYNVKKLLEENDVSLDVKFDPAELHSRGTLIHRIGWQALQLKSTFPDDQNDSLAQQIPRAINRWGAVDEDQLHEWLEGKRPSGEELKQIEFNEFLDSRNAGAARRCRQEDNTYFRLSPYADKTIFCKAHDLQQNIRLQYLRLRAQSEIEFDGVSIPNRIREIPLALIRDFKKRKTFEAIREDEELEEDPDAMRDNGKRRLKQIQTRIFHLCKSLNNNLSYESLVDEKYLIYFGEVIKTSLTNFLNWFRWQPKLTVPLPRIVGKPVDCESATQRLPIQQNRILIKILTGKNIPERKTNAGDVQAAVRPFLEISCEDFITQTSASTGSDPIWNEFVELPLPYHHADYLNPNALNGSISINLFDCIQTHEAPPEDKFWLGEVKIPLAALTTGLNLCGWFKVKTPPVIFGYQKWDELQHVTSNSPKHVNRGAGTDGVYIQLDLRISPSIPSMEPNLADLPSNDIPYIKDHVIKWTEIFNSSFPSKKINALAIDTKGRTSCITRYLRPLEAPQQLISDELEVTPEKCLRYVSLIPFTECSGFYQNVWLTSDQLLNFMIGSVIDHCVTLTCFLLALKMDAYLLLGYGIPQGFTSYVLLSEYSRDSDTPNYFILDVVYNEKINLADPFCPLQRLYCLANGENVWGNAQRTQNPALLRFDLARRSDWWPLFSDTVSAPTNFINNKINFALERDFEDVERQLERKLRRKFSKWRPMEPTSFNRRISEVIKNGLRFFETNVMYGRSNAEVLVEINKAITSQYSVNGIILNTAFTSIRAIIKGIKCLNMHVQQKGVTEFGLSVFVQGYPGQVLSVWIFIGTIFDKSS